MRWGEIEVWEWEAAIGECNQERQKFIYLGFEMYFGKMKFNWTSQIITLS